MDDSVELIDFFLAGVANSRDSNGYNYVPAGAHCGTTIMSSHLLAYVGRRDNLLPGITS